MSYPPPDKPERRLEEYRHVQEPNPNAQVDAAGFVRPLPSFVSGFRIRSTFFSPLFFIFCARPFVLGVHPRALFSLLWRVLFRPDARGIGSAGALVVSWRTGRPSRDFPQSSTPLAGLDPFSPFASLPDKAFFDPPFALCAYQQSCVILPPL